MDDIDEKNWVRVPDRDIEGEGDVHVIKDWYKMGFRLAGLKELCIERGWSGLTIGAPDTPAAGAVFFKHVEYELTEEKTKESKNSTCIWIYKRPKKPNHEDDAGEIKKEEVPADVAEEKKEAPVDLAE